MDYGNIQGSAVPHVTTLTTKFTISYTSYRNTLIMQCSFLILILPTLAMWIYFSSKYKNPKKNQQKQDSHDRERSHDHQSNINPVAENQSRTPSIQEQDQYKLSKTNKKDDQKIKKMLTLVDRRINYFVCFFMFHVAAINSFDSDIMSIVTFYLAILFYLVLNLIRLKKNAFLIGAYIVPTFISAFSFWLGSHKLGDHGQE